MAGSFIASAVPAGNPTTSFTVTIPSGTLTDDILILSVTNRDSDTDPSVTDNDTGGNTWAKITGTGCLTVWWKRATSGSASKTVTCSSLTGSSSGVLGCYRGFRLGTPYENATAEANASGDESHAAITPTRDGCWVFLCVGNDTNDLATDTQAATSPSAITERGEKLSTGGSDCANTQCAAEQTTAESTGTITWAQVNGASASVVFDLIPAATLTVAQGSFTLTGNAVGLTRQANMSVGQGSFALTGIDVGLSHGFSMLVGQGSFALTGQDVGLVYTPAGGYTLAVGQGSFALTGNPVGLTRQALMTVDPGVFVLTGQDVNLLYIPPAGEYYGRRQLRRILRR